jgi:hypothetical protein
MFHKGHAIFEWLRDYQLPSIEIHKVIYFLKITDEDHGTAPG